MITQPCYLYVIQVETGQIKIGIARDIAKRLSELQTGNHQRLSIAYLFQCASGEAAVRLEELLHTRYQSQHIRGEWFDIRPQQIQSDIEFASQFLDVVGNVEVHRYQVGHLVPKRVKSRLPSGHTTSPVKAQIARQHFQDNPGDLDGNGKEIGKRIGVGKSTIYKVMAELKKANQG